MDTVLITGASSGIGKATAKRLLEEGYTVYGAARHVEKMADLKALGAVPLKMDITVEDDIVAVVNQITAEQGGIDVLINNAGFGLYGALEDTPVADARYEMEVNLFGLARLTQLVLPYMRAQKRGKVVNMSSMGGKIYTPLGSWYHASKHALEGLSDCLRIELAPFGVDVIIIEPGIIETDFGEVMLEPMLKRSGSSAYSEMAQKLAKATRDSYEKGDGSPASLIANLVARALKARRPHTRYSAGRLAKPLMTLRKWFGDRVFDWAITREA